MKIVYRPTFLKKLKRSDVLIRKSFKQCIAIFLRNPQDKQLNNHALTREWQGHRSIDITADCRAVYKEIAEGKTTFAFFVALGTHKAFYSCAPIRAATTTSTPTATSTSTSTQTATATTHPRRR